MVLKAVSDVYGEILEMAFSYPGKAIEFHDAPYTKIKRDFGPKVNILAFSTPDKSHFPPHQETHEREILLARIWDDQSNTRWFKEHNSRFNFSRFSQMVEKLEVHKSTVTNTDWIQDAFMVLNSAEGMVVLIQSIYHPRIADGFMAFELAESEEFNYFLKPTFWLLEGGNILVERDFALVGMDMISENILELYQREGGESPPQKERVIKAWEKLLGVKKIIPIGDTRFRNRKPFGGYFQPLYHLDLFLTLGGKDDSGQQIVFLGSPRLAREIIHQEMNISLPEHDEELEIDLENLGKDLQNQATYRDAFSPKFKVVEIPLLFYGGFYYSFNNVLVEVVAGGRKRIFAPEFQTKFGNNHPELNEIIGHLKSHCEQKWHNQYGFEVIWTGDGQYNRMWAEYWGSLRCVTKVLRRGPN